MSYCRWSTDNFRCDLYCYADVGGGYTTHVAGNRIVGDVPPTPSLDLLNILHPEHEARKAEWLRLRNVRRAFMETCERRPIELAHAGETFKDTTLVDFKARLLYLRGLGYQFPDDVLVAIDEQLREVASAAAYIAAALRLDVVGGLAHVVIDDGNLEDGHIDGCLKQFPPEGSRSAADEAAYKALTALKELGDLQREEAYDLSREIYAR